jgi:hypothetical protein
MQSIEGNKMRKNLNLFIIAALVFTSCSSFSKLKKEEIIQYFQYPAVPMYSCKLIGCANDNIYLECSRYNILTRKYRIYVYWAPKSEFNKKELKLLKEALDQRKLYDTLFSEGCNCTF